ncbi:hypothetical protein P4233_08745 [Pseudomonas aeruginosa]|nr:hypothetical protein [Pseudomonas aeruginosa]
MILNQVTGGNRNTLAGYTKVAGQSAQVIIAIRTASPARAAASSTRRARPSPPSSRSWTTSAWSASRWTAAHRRRRRRTNIGNLEQFDLITTQRQAQANSCAKTSTSSPAATCPGRQLQATPRAVDGGEKPQLAIDSSALGGMYAGAIRPVGTEPGGGEAGRRHGRQRRRHPHRRQRQAEPGPGLQPGRPEDRGPGRS